MYVITTIPTAPNYTITDDPIFPCLMSQLSEVPWQEWMSTTKTKTKEKQEQKTWHNTKLLQCNRVKKTNDKI